MANLYTTGDGYMKRLLAVFLLLSVTFSLFGCSNYMPDSSSNDDANVAESSPDSSSNDDANVAESSPDSSSNYDANTPASSPAGADAAVNDSGYLTLAQSVIDQTKMESPEPVYYPDVDDLEYSDLAGMEFWFGSGVGAWSTIVTIESDGKFNGYYHDSDMGDNGAGFPNGTRYECYFNGKFSQLTKVDDYEYFMRVESLFTAGVPGEERIIDGTKIITSEPYGFDNADVFYLYLPSKEADGLSEEFLWWVRDKVGPDGVLVSYCLYNAGGEQGYVVW